MTQKKVKWSDGLRKFIELNPVLIRGVLVSVAALAANIVGREVINDATIEAIISTLTAISALVAALWVRPKVIAESKVLVWQTDPEDASTISPGPLTISGVYGPDSSEIAAQVVDAAMESSTQKEVRNA